MEKYVFFVYHFRKNINKLVNNLIDDPENEIAFDNEISKAIHDGRNLRLLYKCV